MKLELHRHEISVRFLEHAVVPPYEGSMIRGAFGRAFKESCCPFPHDNGKGCPMGQGCPYGYVFETSPPEGAMEFSKNRELPRPYVFEPPEETRMEYKPGERMRFGFTVVGRAADYMPYFIFAFSKMGGEGVGRKRARYELEEIVADNPLSGEREEVFDGETARNVRLPTKWEDAREAARSFEGDGVGVEFLTPAQVKFRGEVSSDAPSFAALVQNLLIRLPMLSVIHCGGEPLKDARGLVERAGGVRMAEDYTSWVSFPRHSSFRGRRDTLEGIEGHAAYEGEALREFLPLLCMGQLAHVGKRAVFGLGRYRLHPREM